MIRAAATTAGKGGAVRSSFITLSFLVLITPAAFAVDREALRRQLDWANEEARIVEEFTPAELRKFQTQYLEDLPIIEQIIPTAPELESYVKRLMLLASRDDCDLTVTHSWDWIGERFNEAILDLEITCAPNAVSVFFDRMTRLARISCSGRPTTSDDGAAQRVSVFWAPRPVNVDLRPCTVPEVDATWNQADRDVAERIGRLCAVIEDGSETRWEFLQLEALRAHVKGLVSLATAVKSDPPACGAFIDGWTPDALTAGSMRRWSADHLPGQADGVPRPAVVTDDRPIPQIGVCELLDHVGETVVVSLIYTAEVSWVGSGEDRHPETVSRVRDPDGCLGPAHIHMSFGPMAVLTAPDDATADRLFRVMLDDGVKTAEMRVLGVLSRSPDSTECFSFEVETAYEVTIPAADD